MRQACFVFVFSCIVMLIWQKIGQKMRKMKNKCYICTLMYIGMKYTMRYRMFIMTLLAVLYVGNLSAQTAAGPYARRFADSEMKRFPEAWQLDHGKRLFFGYAQGVGCCAMLRMWKATGDDTYYNYVYQWADSIINDKGEIHLYTPETYNIDFINSGKVLFDIYHATGDTKYKKAMDVLIKQLRNHPRTHVGGYWHKLCYPHQMWLDGIYMGSPFMAQYGMEFDKPEWIDEAVKQITLCHTYTYDETTGLYHHAWDESKNQRWANKETGTSPNFWGRSIGWWFMALVDVLDFVPENTIKGLFVLIILDDSVIMCVY